VVHQHRAFLLEEKEKEGCSNSLRTKEGACSGRRSGERKKAGAPGKSERLSVVKPGRGGRDSEDQNAALIISRKEDSYTRQRSKEKKRERLSNRRISQVKKERPADVVREIAATENLKRKF